MTLKRTYYCNICNNSIENPIDSFGVFFKNNSEFTLGGYGCTDGVHICYKCARQLHEILTNVDIEEILGGAR